MAAMTAPEIRIFTRAEARKSSVEISVSNVSSPYLGVKYMGKKPTFGTRVVVWEINSKGKPYSML